MIWFLTEMRNFSRNSNFVPFNGIRMKTNHVSSLDELVSLPYRDNVLFQSHILPPLSPPHGSYMVCSSGNHRNQKRSDHTDVQQYCFCI